MDEAEAAVVVDVQQLVISMGAKLEDLRRRRARQWHRPSICRILPRIRQEDNSAYDPKVIAIGPFHRDKEHLRPMEVHKWRYLQDLLARSPVNQLGKCIAGVTTRVKEIRAQYAEVLHVSDEELVTMMVLDGGFIIEFFVKNALGERDTALTSVRWMMPHIMNDLLLLENQVPYFVLETLFEALAPRPFGFSLMNLALITMNGGNFKLLIPGFKPIASPILHCLHLFHSFNVYLSSSQAEPYSCWKATCRQIRKVGKLFSYLCYLVLSVVMCRFPRCWPSDARGPDGRWILPTASDLREAGIRLKSREYAEGKREFFLKVTFTDGNLEIPPIILNDYANCVLRNLIAFEQFSPENGEYCYSGFAFLMDRLVDTDRDVAVLVDSGILVNYLGSAEEAAAFFNKLYRGVSLSGPSGYFDELFREINRYCVADHHRWRARLMHDYFSNPWSVISVAAAVVLLVLTVIQTVFSVMSYYV